MAMISELQKPLSSGFNAKSESLDVLKDIDLNGKTAIVTGGYSGTVSYTHLTLPTSDLV